MPHLIMTTELQPTTEHEGYHLILVAGNVAMQRTTPSRMAGRCRLADVLWRRSG